MKTTMTTVMLYVLCGAAQQVLALGPPVEIQGTLDLMDPGQATFFANGGLQLSFPVDDSIRYENTNRLVLDFDFADMKHLEIAGTDAVDIFIGLLFDDDDLRNFDADIELAFGFTDMNGEVIGDLIDVPFSPESGVNQIGGFNDIGFPFLLPESPLVFHDVLIIAETDDPDGLFSVDLFSFNDNSPIPAISFVDPTGGGVIRVGQWVPEPATALMLMLGTALLNCGRSVSVS